VPRDWDARTYDRIAVPMTRWGSAVLERLPLDGGETVLDAGCGSGRVTEMLAERLPTGRVIAVDGSPAMVDAARSRLARFGDRVEVVVADLGQPLPIAPGSLDAVLSTATFHWVPDHDSLFRRLASVTRSGGWLVAQCGGAGNIASIERALTSLGDDLRGVHFETAEETALRLEAAGYGDIRCWLTEEPTRLDAGEPFETYLRTVVLGAHVQGMPPEEQARLVRAVADAVGEPVIDYVRLNIVARRTAVG